MEPLYNQDLAHIHAAAFGNLAQGAAPEIIRLLKCAAAQIRRVVDVGCGAGPLSAALVEAGFEVTGIDTSAELLAIARTAIPRAHFLHGSVYETQIPACEAIVALGEPLTYHADGSDADTLVESFFRAASDVLPVGGMLIFDVIELGGPHWRAGIGTQARIGPYWPRPRRIRARGRWSETSKPSGGSASSTGGDAKFTEYGFSTLLHSGVNSLGAGSQPRLHKPMAGRSWLLVVARFFPLACVESGSVPPS